MVREERRARVWTVQSADADSERWRGKASRKSGRWRWSGELELRKAFLRRLRTWLGDLSID